MSETKNFLIPKGNSLDLIIESSDKNCEKASKIFIKSLELESGKYNDKIKKRRNKIWWFNE